MTSPLGIKAGHCTACGELIWRSAQLQRNAWGLKAGHSFIVWPRPDTVYARLETQTGHAPGIAYCRGCMPAIGSVGPACEGASVMDFETAYDRYLDWYVEERRPFWESWLRDGLFLDAVQIADLMTIWENDRSECTRLRDADAGDPRFYRREPDVERWSYRRLPRPRRRPRARAPKARRVGRTGP